MHKPRKSNNSLRCIVTKLRNPQILDSLKILCVLQYSNTCKLIFSLSYIMSYVLFWFQIQLLFSLFTFKLYINFVTKKWFLLFLCKHIIYVKNLKIMSTSIFVSSIFSYYLLTMYVCTCKHILTTQQPIHERMTRIIWLLWNVWSDE